MITKLNVHLMMHLKAVLFIDKTSHVNLKK